MKKMIKTLVAVLLALTMLLGCAALAEEQEKDYAELYPESLVFDSRWAADNTILDACCEDGGFRVSITRDDSLEERTIWEYSPLYDRETGTLIASLFGLKTHQYLDMDGEVIRQTVEYEDGSAVFALNADGSLVWKDEKEDAGKDLVFAKIGRFDGIYVCDRASIELIWNGEGAYSVLIEWADSVSECHYWLMNGYYNPETDAIEAMGTESVAQFGDDGEITDVQEVNEEGCSAVFSFDGQGNLLWTGTEGTNTDGMVFEPFDTSAENG